MLAILRRLKGVVGNALTWAVGWALCAVGLAVVTHLINPLGSLSERILTWGAEAGILGFVVGGGFSLVIAGTFRNRRVSDLSATWFGVIGACTGMAFPVAAFVVPTIMAGGSLTLGAVIWPLALFGGMGAAVAVGSLKVARHAPGVIEEAGEAEAVGDGGVASESMELNSGGA